MHEEIIPPLPEHMGASCCISQAAITLEGACTFEAGASLFQQFYQRKHFDPELKPIRSKENSTVQKELPPSCLFITE